MLEQQYQHEVEPQARIQPFGIRTEAEWGRLGFLIKKAYCENDEFALYCSSEVYLATVKKIAHVEHKQQLCSELPVPIPAPLSPFQKLTALPSCTGQSSWKNPIYLP